MSRYKVAVVGVGGVGGYIAAKLVKAGIDTTLIARGKNLEALQTNGLTVIEDDKSYTLKVNAKSVNEINERFDIVLFCVKSYDLKESFIGLKSHINSDAVVISLANGVNNGEILANEADCEVIEGCVYILSHIQSPGVVRKEGDVFRVVFDGMKSASSKIKEIFEASHLNFKASSNIKRDLWRKYIFISAFANLTTCYDKSIYEVANEIEDEAREVLKEIATIAKFEGIEIESEIEKSIKIALSLPQNSSTSMHLDFKRGKRIEIEALSDYLLQKAKIFNFNPIHLHILNKKIKDKII
jgi:2-dehydropantoate 2-reductase